MIQSWQSQLLPCDSSFKPHHVRSLIKKLQKTGALLSVVEEGYKIQFFRGKANTIRVDHPGKSVIVRASPFGFDEVAEVVIGD